MDRSRMHIKSKRLGFMLLTILCLIVFSFTACSKDSGDEGPQTTPPEDNPKPEPKKTISFDQNLAKDVLFAAYAGANPAVETDDVLNLQPIYLSEVTTGFFRTFLRDTVKLEFTDQKRLLELLQKGGLGFISFILGISPDAEIKGIELYDSQKNIIGRADLKIHYNGKSTDIGEFTWKKYTFNMTVDLDNAGFSGNSDTIPYKLTGNGTEDLTFIWNTSACLYLTDLVGNIMGGEPGAPIILKMKTGESILDYGQRLINMATKIYNSVKDIKSPLELMGVFGFVFKFDTDSGKIVTSDNLTAEFSIGENNPVKVKYDNWSIDYSSCGTANDGKQFNFWELPQLSPLSNANHMSNFYKLEGRFSINDKFYRYDMVYGQIDEGVFSNGQDKGSICVTGFGGKISVPRLNDLNQMVDVDSKHSEFFKNIFYEMPVTNYNMGDFKGAIDMHFNNIVLDRTGTGFNQGSMKLSYKKPGDSEAAKASILFNSDGTVRIDANPAMAGWKKDLSPIK